jgi:hypothetical protein
MGYGIARGFGQMYCGSDEARIYFGTAWARGCTFRPLSPHEPGCSKVAAGRAPFTRLDNRRVIERPSRGTTKTCKSSHWEQGHGHYLSSPSRHGPRRVRAPSVMQLVASRRTRAAPGGDGDGGGAATRPVRIRLWGAGVYGSLDTVGNVDEWLADWYGQIDDENRDSPTGPEEASERSFRGGGYTTVPFSAYSASRWSKPPNQRFTRSRLSMRCFTVRS